MMMVLTVWAVLSLRHVHRVVVVLLAEYAILPHVTNTLPKTRTTTTLDSQPKRSRRSVIGIVEDRCAFACGRPVFR